jgi:hypothetical protein
LPLVALVGFAPDGSEKPKLSIPLEEPTPQKPVVAGAAIAPSKAAPGQTMILVVKAKTAATWHIYAADRPTDGAIATTLKLKLPEGIATDGEWHYPTPVPNPQGEGWVYEGDLIFYRTLKTSAGRAPGPIEVSCDFGYQACDPSSCRPPTKIALKAKAEVVAGK